MMLPDDIAPVKRRKLNGRAAMIAGFLVLAPALAACTAEDALRGVGDQRGEVSMSKKLQRTLKTKGMSRSAPIMVRIFKEEDKLEVWKQKPNGRYDMVADYEICKWSGKLGPKFKEGDRQAPEGFYSVAPHQMNPRSSYHLSFNMGFPNRFDASHGRTGTHLMIHGDCSSAGCYSMTDSQIEDIYALARDALRGGQERFQIQAFPFRMTPENMAKHADSEHFEFWQNIKIGYDHFELTKTPPDVTVCGRRYEFNKDFGDASVRASEDCPAQFEQNPNLLAAYGKLKAEENAVFEKLTARYAARKGREEAAAERQVARLSPPAETSETAEDPAVTERLDATAPQAEVSEVAAAAPDVAPLPATAPVTERIAAVPTAEEAPTTPAEQAASVATATPLPQEAPDETTATVAPAQPVAPARRSVFGRVKGLFGS